MKLKRLPDAELEVMKAIWELGPGTARADLEQMLPDQWKLSTINTYLRRLEEKGYVEADRDPRGKRYTALVSREAYLSFESRTVVDRLYGSPRNFVAALARTGLRPGEAEELRSLLDELKDPTND